MSGNDSNNEFPPGESGAAGGGEAPLNTGRPAVAAAPGKLLFVMLFAGIFILIIVRSLFFGEKQEVKPPVTHHKESVTAESAHSQNELSISPGSLPAPPTAELTNNVAAAPPPPPPPA